MEFCLLFCNRLKFLKTKIELKMNRKPVLQRHEFPNHQQTANYRSGEADLVLQDL